MDEIEVGQPNDASKILRHIGTERRKAADQRNRIHDRMVRWLRHKQFDDSAVLEIHVDETKNAPNLLADVILSKFGLTDRAYVRYRPCVAENAKAWRE